MRTEQFAPAGVPTFERCDLDLGADALFYLTRIESHRELPRSYAHRHRYFHLIWVTHGCGSHMIDFRDYPVRDNTLFLVSPGQIHRWARPHDTCGHLFNFDREIFVRPAADGLPGEDELLEQLYDHPAFSLEPDEAAPLAELIAQIEREHGAAEPWAGEIVRGLFWVLLLHVARLGQARAGAPRPGAQGTAQRFRALVEKRFRDCASIAEYAALLAVSERQLAEATKRACGRTPKQILQERVLLEAKRMLLHSDLGVAEIAHRLNFDDPAYFGRFFRKHAAMAPGAYKRTVISVPRALAHEAQR